MTHSLPEPLSDGARQYVPFVPDRLYSPVPKTTATVVDHPVFSLLDVITRGKLLDAGAYRTVAVGEIVSINGCVTFVLEGLLGTISQQSGVCVGVLGPGSVVGMESGFDVPGQSRLVALSVSQVFAAPAAVLIDGLGRSRVLELCMRQSLERLRAMELEAACNAAHAVPQRLARWILKLHRANQGRDIYLTQAEVAGLMAVTRTSVNAAAKLLHTAGVAKFTRGRIVVRDVEGLTRASCQCAG